MCKVVLYINTQYSLLEFFYMIFVWLMLDFLLMDVIDFTWKRNKCIGLTCHFGFALMHIGHNPNFTHGLATHLYNSNYKLSAYIPNFTTYDIQFTIVCINMIYQQVVPWVFQETKFLLDHKFIKYILLVDNSSGV